ncbi:DNA-3-methyladenine glycosylase 2 family protein [Subdoligranulum sp. DSM 109015]|uniref:DNA-(apurinic or apyrimidinic site) lyase n=1 Tax=Gemmiger gallinarum TaxID=2779354 RepID=A0ABR9R2Z0_9FIRM|nr:DNA-3-methyladenine glycosylase 2 family protein [Gemmiger gallinarum]MBE5037526.1 DNA-3-methyladenine glycosylase 2 family protein [Gemmiger gallinarum]
MDESKVPGWHVLGSAGGMDLDQTLTSGQCFRWQRQADGWHGIAEGRRVTAKVEDDMLWLLSPPEEDGFWRHYFALDTDYGALHRRFAASKRLASCVEAAPGLRVLNQPFFEVLCTFLISQNNNIPRIKGIVERLCMLCGEELAPGVYAFPAPEALATQTPESMAVLRAGWRSDYLLNAARRVCDGALDPQTLSALPMDAAREQLMQLRGVGPKVADCVLLYGLGFADACPMDVWMKRAMAVLFPRGMPRAAGACKGIAQQYIFEYARTHLPRGEKPPAKPRKPGLSRAKSAKGKTLPREPEQSC